jgi:hypothetical protein
MFTILEDTGRMQSPPTGRSEHISPHVEYRQQSREAVRLSLSGLTPALDPRRDEADFPRSLAGRARQCIKVSSQARLVIDGAVIHKANGDRTSGNCSRHPCAEVERDAALQRCINCDAIDIAHCAGDVVARVSHARCCIAAAFQVYGTNATSAIF